MIEEKVDRNLAGVVTGVFLGGGFGGFLGWRGGAMKRLLEGPDPWPAIPGRPIPRFLVCRPTLWIDAGLKSPTDVTGVSRDVSGLGYVSRAAIPSDSPYIEDIGPPNSGKSMEGERRWFCGHGLLF